MAQPTIVAGPDTGNDDDLLKAIGAGTPKVAATPPPAPDLAAELRKQLADQQAELLQLRAQLAAAGTGRAPEAGQPAATPVVVAERVFRTEFVMHEGMTLGDGLHESFCSQTVRRAHEAGYVTRGPAHRTAWGVDKDGQKTAVYEIYARKA